MNVQKRDGRLEPVSFDKIMHRLMALGADAGNLPGVQYAALSIKVIDQLHDGITTAKLDELAAEQCAAMMTISPDYGILAARIVISNHQKMTPDTFSECVRQMNEAGILDALFVDTVNRYGDVLDKMIRHDRDYCIDYFGFKTLEKSYLTKLPSGKLVERIQYVWMRVAVALHGPGLNDDDENEDVVANALARIQETYDLMSTKHFIHATPTLYNAGMKRQQMSSCFLVAMQSDSIEGIYDTLKECALISKYSGGIGLHVSNVRSKGSYIAGTNGSSDGIVPMLRVFNSTARYVNQSGRRNGSFAIYLEPWHPDVAEFLEMKKNHGDEERKGRDLFYALWVPDLFMRRVKENGKWSLFCPNECPGLLDAIGEDFDTLYETYETQSPPPRSKRTISARDLWFLILDSQMETGTPYLLYKDACNRKSNQSNVGVIRSSNLCTEIVEYSDSNETAVCNLGSIGLPTFVCKETRTFDYTRLHATTKVLARNLDRVIDMNYYPTDRAKYSNWLHRPIGIGVQGLADVFVLMGMAFCSSEAREVNRRIFETIYHAALETSCELAEEIERTVPNYSYVVRAELAKRGSRYLGDWGKATDEGRRRTGVYPSYWHGGGCPASRAMLQFDMWKVKPTENWYDWDGLKARIMQFGLRNSLSVAPMPTASTSQILGFNECIEPFTSNIYTRRTLVGDFVVINKYLIQELVELGQWNEQIKNNIVANRGSVQQLTMLSEEMRDKYRIVWEMPMKSLIDMAVDRGAYVCQSQSMNLWLEDPTYKTMTSMHFYGWERGLKTGIYYLRRKAKHATQQFTIEPSAAPENTEPEETDEICASCSA